ncbi:hypothetical protein Tco_1538492 [Tanacetum coccineum]
MAQLEIQLDKEEIHECDSKNRLTRLKEKFEKFFYRKPNEDFLKSDSSGIEKGIDTRVPHEEVLRIKERDVNERRKKERHVIELEMLKLEKMTQKGACSNRGNAQRAKLSKKKCLLMDFIEKVIAKRGLYMKAHDNRVHERTLQTHEGMISKDASEIDNNVARSSHDKDNIIEVQISKNKMFENVFAHDHEKMKTDPKTLKEEIVLLKKEIEAYKERVWDFNEKQYIEKLEQEKNELQDQILKIKNATDFVKKAFKQDKDKYVNNIIQLEAKNKNLENIVCLGYTDPCPLGQAITCHPKLYDAEVLGLHYVKPDVHGTEEILNDAEESRNLYDTKEMSDLLVLNMPKESRLLQMFDKLGDALSGFYTKINKTLLKDAERRWLSDSQNELREFYKTDVIPTSRSLYMNLQDIKEELIEEVQEMLNIFESMENKVNRTLKKHEILQNNIDQLLEANIANDVKNLVMQSYLEIKNKEEIERISKESKDSEKFCNDVVEVKEKLSKQIVQLEKDFAKLEAQSIAFEIALQHKTQENNSLKTLQKENENFMASLQIENSHLKQTYKDLFESVQSSRLETIQRDEVKIKFDFEKIETQNIKLEHRVASLLKENEHLKLTYQNLFDSIKNSNVNCNIYDLEKKSGEKKNIFESETCVFQTKIVELEKNLAKQTKENSDLLMKIYNLENAFAAEVKGVITRKLNVFDKENCDFGSKVTHLEKIIAQKTKDFDDVKLELSNRTDKFEAYFKKLENTKVVLERQLARKVDDSKAKKINF